jgi:hypothetical protein
MSNAPKEPTAVVGGAPCGIGLERLYARSAHGSHEGHPGARHLYGEVRCDALEQLQRQALDRPRPQLVVKVDRSVAV